MRGREASRLDRVWLVSRLAGGLCKQLGAGESPGFCAMVVGAGG